MESLETQSDAALLKAWCLECLRYRNVNAQGICQECEQEEETENRVATALPSGDSYLAAGV